MTDSEVTAVRATTQPTTQPATRQPAPEQATATPAATTEVISVDDLDGFTLSGDEDGGIALYCQVPPHEGGYNHGPIAQHDGPMRLGTTIAQLADAARAHLTAEHPSTQGG